MSHTKIQQLKKTTLSQNNENKNSIFTHSKHLKQKWIADRNNKTYKFYI